MIAQLDQATLEVEPHFNDKMPPKPKRSLRSNRLMLIGAIALTLVLLATYSWFAATHLPPRTTLDEVAVGGLTPLQAVSRYQKESPSLPTQLLLSTDDGVASHSAILTADQLRIQQDPQAAIEAIYPPQDSAVAHILSFSRRLFIVNNIDLPINYDESAVQNQVMALAAIVDQVGRAPSVTLETSNVATSLVVDAGAEGKVLDSTASAQLIAQAINERRESVILPTIKSGRVLEESSSEQLTERASQLVGKQIVATAERLQLSLNDKQLISLIDPFGTWDQQKIDEIVKDWQLHTGTQPINPELKYDPTTLKVESFTPPRNGRTIQQEPTKTMIASALDELTANKDQKTVSKELTLSETPPSLSLASLNNLGINERIGLGESKYAHSIPNRIHNVAITSDRINNVIVPPGAEFSFNKTVGDVSAATGYKSAYVIKNGKTELGDGGGVCQVSTTLFRSVMNAGLEVTKRLPHSYRVSYYELDSKPGADATVYAGDVDFRFKNDTPGHILIHSVADSKNTAMYVEMYGTSDGRHTQIVEHKTWDARPALPPQYFPDPTLAPGKLVQIDWATPGIRASLTNVIYDKNDKEIRRDTYVSNYKPWAAKYLQGVTP